MATHNSYGERLESHNPPTAFNQLAPPQQDFIRERAQRHRFTFQELKRVSEAALDLQMWGDLSFQSWWEREETKLQRSGRNAKKRLLERLEAWLQSLRSSEKSYPLEGLPKPTPIRLQVASQESDKNIVGMCPVASEETVCCNLRTIDAVENCGFGCSYCTIQTFYGNQVVIDSGLGDKLKNLDLDPNRFYHLGTGQSSDSLMWGNQYGVLDSLCEFAKGHPRVLLELKTKSKNVAYFLEGTIPPNVVVSWSLNTPTIIHNEEHFTASLTERLAAARQVADRGIKIGFHFHPLVFYRSWRRDYRDLAEQVLSDFKPDEVAFISFGTVTFIKPVIQAIRRRGRPTKMLQMELVPGPKGKLSYPDPIKKKLFAEIYRAFAPWHGKVFMYLCMEKAELWTSTFGFVYASNVEFEADFGQKVLEKLKTQKMKREHPVGSESTR